MQTTVKGGSPDLIAYAWFRIGYRPRESVVLVGVRGPRRQTGMIARVDLPPVRQRGQALAHLAGMLRRAGDDAAIALVVSDVVEHDGGILAHRGVARRLRTEGRRAGLTVLDVLAVGAHAYRSYFCTGRGCCPPAGHPLADVMATETAAQMVLDGHVVAEREDGLIADVEPDAHSSCGSEIDCPAPGEVTSIHRSSWLARWRRLVDDVVAGGPSGLDPASVAWLIPALEDQLFRDAVLFTLLPPDPEALIADPAQAVLDGRAEELGRMLDAAPEPSGLVPARAVLAAVARCAPRGRRAEALAVLAWIAWWEGVGARARLLASSALADRPEHRLAGLVEVMLAAGIPPPWVDTASDARRIS